jgi:hypothetical protein
MARLRFNSILFFFAEEYAVSKPLSMAEMNSLLLYPSCQTQYFSCCELFAAPAASLLETPLLPSKHHATCHQTHHFTQPSTPNSA